MALSLVLAKTYLNSSSSRVVVILVHVVVFYPQKVLIMKFGQNASGSAIQRRSISV